MLSMQNNYKGPPEDFAMVVPVPVVLHEGDVKTLPQGRVRRTSTARRAAARRVLGAGPVLRRRAAGRGRDDGARRRGTAERGADERGRGEHSASRSRRSSRSASTRSLILSATDSTGLDTWLRENNYKIPDGAEPLLRPYVEAG